MNPLTQYSGITIYNDKGDKVGDINPTTTGHSKTLTFPTDKVQQGTRIRMAYSFCDGHEISDRFEFSVGKKTLTVLIHLRFYETPNFWFGLFRYIVKVQL